jgi:mannose-6-phosphate isomerase-like protein (cupin superfamily)
VDLRTELADWPVESAAAAVVDAGGVRAAHDPGRTYRWASVTKLLAALVVLDAAEHGHVDLDEPAGPPGSTLRHLLAHASGLAFDSDQVISVPGKRRIYSNRGIEVAVAHLESRTAEPFPVAVARAVLDPLGMAGTVIDGSAAYAASGPLADLAALAQELMAPRLFTPQTISAATRTAFPGLPGVLPGFGRQVPNDWGLGFEIRGEKHPHWTGRGNSPATFGHFGRSGSFLWVDPRAGLACVSLSATDFGPWAIDRWPRLSDRVLGAFTASWGSSPERWEDHLAARPTVRQAGAMLAVNIAAEVAANDAFRRVLATSAHVQVVAMLLQPGEDIGSEVHEHNDQILTFIEGHAIAEVGGQNRPVGPGDLVLVPAGTRHNFTNVGDVPVRLYTIYGPPDHADGVVHLTKADALRAEAEGSDQPPGHS